jgi:hypothetical protein
MQLRPLERVPSPFLSRVTPAAQYAESVAWSLNPTEVGNLIQGPSVVIHRNGI